jgi:hypothetical protein
VVLPCRLQLSSAARSPAIIMRACALMPLMQAISAPGIFGAVFSCVPHWCLWRGLSPLAAGRCCCRDVAFSACHAVASAEHLCLPCDCTVVRFFSPAQRRRYSWRQCCSSDREKWCGTSCCISLNNPTGWKSGHVTCSGSNCATCNHSCLRNE